MSYSVSAGDYFTFKQCKKITVARANQSNRHFNPIPTNLPATQ